MTFYLSKGVEICNFSITGPKNPEHERYWRQVNLLDRERLRKEILAFSPTHIAHLAARTGFDETKDISHYALNFKGVANLIDVTKDLPNLKRVIFTSSMLVCKIGYYPKDENDYCPTTLYGKSKVVGEKVVRDAKDIPFSWVIVRPIGIWGPWFGTPYKEFFLTIANGLYVHPREFCVNQSLGFVGNTVYQVHKLMEAPVEKVHGKTFYLADYPPTNLQTWADVIQKTTKARKIRTVPVWVLKTAALLGDLAKSVGWKHPPLTSFRLNNMLTSFEFSLDPILTDELPYTLEEAVQITVDWLYKRVK